MLLLAVDDNIVKLLVVVSKGIVHAATCCQGYQHKADGVTTNERLEMMVQCRL